MLDYLRTIQIAVNGNQLDPKPSEGSAEWWRRIVSVPGVTLAWLTPAEQTALLDQITRRTNTPQDKPGKVRVLS
jgi:hypothetical protein